MALWLLVLAFTLVSSRGTCEVDPGDRSRVHVILHLPLSWRCLLPVLPGVVTAAGHSQPATQPGNGVLISELIDQAIPLGGSCSLAKCAAASLKKSFSLLSSRFSRRS